MKVVLFGGTGMIGQGVLRECLLDPDVEKVLTIGRSAMLLVVRHGAPNRVLESADIQRARALNPLPELSPGLQI